MDSGLYKLTDPFLNAHFYIIEGSYLARKDRSDNSDGIEPMVSSTKLLTDSSKLPASIFSFYSLVS